MQVSGQVRGCLECFQQFSERAQEMTGVPEGQVRLSGPAPSRRGCQKQKLLGPGVGGGRSLQGSYVPRH